MSASCRFIFPLSVFFLLLSCFLQLVPLSLHIMIKMHFLAQENVWVLQKILQDKYCSTYVLYMKDHNNEILKNLFLDLYLLHI